MGAPVVSSPSADRHTVRTAESLVNSGNRSGTVRRMGHDPVIEALLGSLAADPGNHPVRVHVAQLLLDAGRSADALTHATTVLAAEPDNIAALRIAAAAARAGGDEGKAASYARLADA